MTCCLMTPSHHLNQCWHIISKVPWHSSKGIIIRRSEDGNQLYKIACLKSHPDLPGDNELTHWGRVTHICVGILTSIGSDKGLSPERRQAIIWTNAGRLLIWPLRTNFNEILIEIYIYSFKKMHLKMSSGKWRPFCLGLNVLRPFCILYLPELYSVPYPYEPPLVCGQQVVLAALLAQTPGQGVGLSEPMCYRYGWESLEHDHVVDEFQWCFWHSFLLGGLNPSEKLTHWCLPLSLWTVLFIFFYNFS